MRPDLQRPPAVPNTFTPVDQLLAAGLGVGAAASGLVWATGQLAGLAFGHTWLELDPAEVARVVLQLRHHSDDPALAWPTAAQQALPGPAGMYASFVATTAGAAGATGGAMRLWQRVGFGNPNAPGARVKRPAAGSATWATPRELRPLRVRKPPARPGDPRPAQQSIRAAAGKPITAIRWWSSGPRGASRPPGWSSRPSSSGPDRCWLPRSNPTSSKRPAPIGERRGEVVVLDPLGASGLAGARWTPLAFCRTWAGAQQMAATIAHTADLGTLGTAEHKYWKTLGQKLLAPLLFAAARDDRTMTEALRWVDLREDNEVAKLLEAAGVDGAITAWEASQSGLPQCPPVAHARSGSPRSWPSTRVRPARAGLAGQAVGWARGREKVELLGPRVTRAAWDENAQPSQHRVATVTHRAVQARIQARQQRSAQRAEQTRTHDLAARTHQRLLAREARQRQPAGGRPDRTRPATVSTGSVTVNAELTRLLREGRWVQPTSAAGVLGIGAAAFLLSYDALHSLALASGVRPGLARIWPGVLDRFIVVAPLTVVAAKRASRPTWYPWALVVLFSAASVAFNILHAVDQALTRAGWVAALVFAMPPVALVLATHLLLQQGVWRRQHAWAASAAGEATPEGRTTPRVGAMTQPAVATSRQPESPAAAGAAGRSPHPPSGHQRLHQMRRQGSCPPALCRGPSGRSQAHRR